MPASVGMPDRGGELGDRELRDQGGAGSGDGEAGLAVVPHGGRLVQGVDRVHARPGHRRLQHPGLRRHPPGPGPRAPADSSTAAAVSRSAAVLPVMTQFQHRPPTVSPRKPGSPQGSGETFSKTFSRPSSGSRSRASSRQPEPVSGPAAQRRVVSTSSTERGGVVSTSSTTEQRAWSRRARPPTSGVVSTGSITDERRGLDRLDHRRARWSRRVLTSSRPPSRPGRPRTPGCPACGGPSGSWRRRCGGGGSWRGCEAPREPAAEGQLDGSARFGARSTCAA